MKLLTILTSLLLLNVALADTPPPGTVGLKGSVATGSTPIGAVGDALKVNISGGTISGTVNQGTAGSSPWPVTGPSGALALDATSLVLSTKLSTIISTLGSPFQVGGSIGNTAFGISGTLPSYASTPTFNIGTLNGAATSALQTTGNTSLSSIDTKTPALVSGRVPVDGSGVTQPISASSLPLPSGAATSALQTTINTTLGSPFQAGGSIGNTAFGISGTLPSYAATPTFNLGSLNGAATAALQTTGNAALATIATNTTNAGTPVVTGTVTANAGTNLNTSALALESGGHLASIDSKAPALGQALSAASVPVVLPAAQITTLTPPTSVAVTQPTASNLNATVVQTALVTGNIVVNSSITTTASTLSAPANAIGFILEAESGNSDNVRWAIGSVATSSLGVLMEPGRDSGYIPLDANISVIAISGTQTVDIQWVLR